MSKDRSKVLQGPGSFSLFVIAQPPFSYERIGFQGNREGAEKDCSLHSQPHSSPSSFLLLSVLSKRGFLPSGFPVDVSEMFRLVFSFFYFFLFSGNHNFYCKERYLHDNLLWFSMLRIAVVVFQNCSNCKIASKPLSFDC